MKKHHVSVLTSLPMSRSTGHKRDRASPQEKETLRNRLVELAEVYEVNTGEEVWMRFGNKGKVSFSPERPQRPMSIGELTSQSPSFRLSRSTRKSSPERDNPQIRLLTDSALCLDNAVKALEGYTATFQGLIGQLGKSVAVLQKALREMETGERLVI